jgi:hypothetical protein
VALDTVDLVLVLDYYQANSKEAHRCQVDDTHGRLTATAAGQALICAAPKCPGGVRVDGDLIQKAVNLKANDRFGQGAVTPIN